MEPSQSMPSFQFRERLDLFLKWSGLVRRRALAKWLCERGAVQVNGQPGKAGRAISVGDRITLSRGQRRVTVVVLALPEHSGRRHRNDPRGGQACYRILREEPWHERETMRAER